MIGITTSDGLMTTLLGCDGEGFRVMLSTAISPLAVSSQSRRTRIENASDSEFSEQHISKDKLASARTLSSAR